ncbi:MAG: hypothetical protein JWQ42_1516 [Edaphobacter sp.]|nr:hypothetical protein [Edaphobacter sp.]
MLLTYRNLLNLRVRGILSLVSLVVLGPISGVVAQRAVAQAQAAAKPSPDVVIFRNGDQLTGTLERGEGDSVIFKSDLVGEVTISMDKVKELRSGGSFAVLKKGEKITRTSRQPGSLTFTDSSVALSHPGGAVETIPVKDISYVIDGETYNKEVIGNPGIWFGWKGSIVGGATIVQSTQTGQNYTAGINLVRSIPTVPYLPPRTRTTFNLLETYGKLTQPTIPQTNPATPDLVIKTNIFHTDFEHDKYLTQNMYALVGATYDHNSTQGLSLQQIYGAGLGWTVLKNAAQQLDLKADVHYERQNFNQTFLPPTPNQDLIGSTFAEDYKRTLPGKLLLTESGTYIQSWNNFQAYSAIGAVGLALPVYHRFSLSVNALDNFINNPAFGFKKNSFQFVTGITYTLP